MCRAFKRADYSKSEIILTTPLPAPWTVQESISSWHINRLQVTIWRTTYWLLLSITGSWVSTLLPHSEKHCGAMWAMPPRIGLFVKTKSPDLYCRYEHSHFNGGIKSKWLCHLDTSYQLIITTLSAFMVEWSTPVQNRWLDIWEKARYC